MAARYARFASERGIAENEAIDPFLNATLAACRT